MGADNVTPMGIVILDQSAFVVGRGIGERDVNTHVTEKGRSQGGGEEGANWGIANGSGRGNVQETLAEWQSRVIHSREETDRGGVPQSVGAIAVEQMTEMSAGNRSTCVNLGGRGRVNRRSQAWREGHRRGGRT
jgi:hypothetical protein